MSVLFLPPPSASAIPDASETVSGKIRIATSAEATAGTNDLTAITPLKLKSVVDAAVVGGVTYQGTFDASAPADLSNATKGDLYIISVAGTYQGQTWAVGDHLLINADMGGTLDPAKIDKVDNTDSVTSVAGRTGAVTLSTADISGLATVASTGAYSDLTGTPTLATVATTGAYSDLSGTPTLGTAAAEDVGTGAGNVVQLNGSAQLPAVDGSLLTGITASVAALNDVGDVNAASPANTNVIKYNSTSGDWEASAVTASEVSGLATIATSGSYDDLSNKPILRDQTAGTVTITAPSSPAIISHVNIPTAASQSVSLPASSAAIAGTQITIHNSSTVYSTDVTAQGGDIIRRGTGGGATTFTLEPRHSVTVSYVASGSGVALFVTGFDTGLDVGTSANNLVQLDGTAKLPAVDGSQLTNLPSGASTLGALTDVDVTGAVNTNVLKYNSTSGDWEDGAVAYSEVTGTPTLATVATTGAYSDLTGTPTLATVATTGAYSDLSGTPTNVSTFTNDAGYLTAITGESVGDLSDVTLTTPSAGQALVYNGTLSVFENSTITATVSALNDIGDVSAAAPNNGDVIAYNSTSGDWEATAQSGGGSAPSVTVSSPSTDQTLTTPSGIEEVYVYTPSTSISVNLVAAATCGSGFKYQIKNASTNTITIDPNGTETIDGASTFALSTQYASATIVTDGSNWFII